MVAKNRYTCKCNFNTIDQLKYINQSFQAQTNTNISAIFTSALVWNKYQEFLFVIHIAQIKWILFIAYDASILLKTLDDLQNYIEETYMLRQNLQVAAYQMQY